MPIQFWNDNGEKYHQAYLKNLKMFGIMVIIFLKLVIMDLLYMEDQMQL